LAKLENYYRVDMQARASVSDRLVPISGLKVEYALDAVPTATIDIALGRSPTGDKRVAGAGVFSNLPPFTSMEVAIGAVASPRGRDAPRQSGNLPEEFLVFEGYVLSPAMMTSAAGQAVLKIDGFGRLGGLSGGTTLDEGVVVNHASDGTAIFTSRFAKGDKNLTALDGILAGNLHRNIGEGVAHMINQALTGSSIWLKDSPATTAASVAAQRAADMLTVLNRFEMITDLTSTAEALFARSVAGFFSTIFWDSWVTASNNQGVRIPSQASDLWTTLKALARGFGFKIVPVVQRAFLAPITPDLDGEPNNLFYPDEYELVAGGTHMIEKSSGRPMYAYVTQVGLFSSYFIPSKWNDGSSVAGRVGYATVNPALANKSFDGGKLMLYQAPTWLLYPGAAAKGTMDVYGGIPDAASPTGGSGSGQREAEIALFQAKLGNRLAETLLHQILFEHRTLVIKGRFRVDVAPGNIVKVVLPSESFIRIEGDVLFGMVQKVILEMRTTESGSFAYTTVVLSHLRTQQEYDSEGLSIPYHPLYLERWQGATLV